MTKYKNVTILILALVLLAGCATVPTGPSVMVLPPAGKPFDLFRAEDASCRQWAGQQIGLSPQETYDKNTAGGAAVGTAVGAGIGAVLGSASGHAGRGAVIGAATGLLVGASSGAESGRYYGSEAQRRYDIAYQQCMYAQGNTIPGVVHNRRVQQRMPPPPDLRSVPNSNSDPYFAPPLPAPPVR